MNSLTLLFRRDLNEFSTQYTINKMIRIVSTSAKTPRLITQFFSITSSYFFNVTSTSSSSSGVTKTRISGGSVASYISFVVFSRVTASSIDETKSYAFAGYSRSSGKNIMT